MKKLFHISVCFILGLTLSSMTSAEEEHLLTILNHFDKALIFTITINPHVLPDFPQSFSIEKNDSKQTRVLELGKESYLRVDEKEGHKAFWGVEIENQKVKIHGYISKGIAYSWKGSRIIFCTPEDYKKNHGCI